MNHIWLLACMLIIERGCVSMKINNEVFLGNIKEYIGHKDTTVNSC